MQSTRGGGLTSPNYFFPKLRGNVILMLGGVGGGPGLDVSVGLKIERHYAISIACP